MQYKYLYEDNSTKCVVTSIIQLSGLSGISSRRIGYALRKSNTFNDKYGKFKIEKVKYIKDGSKKRDKSMY